MKVINYSDFRTNLAESLNSVNEDKEIYIVSRTKGKNVVVMDLDEYNSLQETMHLTSSSKNRLRLQAALEELKAGASQKKKLVGK